MVACACVSTKDNITECSGEVLELLGGLVCTPVARIQQIKQLTLNAHIIAKPPNMEQVSQSDCTATTLWPKTVIVSSQAELQQMSGTGDSRLRAYLCQSGHARQL